MKSIFNLSMTRTFCIISPQESNRLHLQLKFILFSSCVICMVLKTGLTSLTSPITSRSRFHSDPANWTGKQSNWNWTAWTGGSIGEPVGSFWTQQFIFLPHSPCDWYPHCHLERRSVGNGTSTVAWSNIPTLGTPSISPAKSWKTLPTSAAPNTNPVTPPPTMDWKTLLPRDGKVPSH